MIKNGIARILIGVRDLNESAAIRLSNWTGGGIISADHGLIRLMVLETE